MYAHIITTLVCMHTSMLTDPRAHSLPPETKLENILLATEDAMEDDIVTRGGDMYQVWDAAIVC